MRRYQYKVEAGAEFAVTEPVFDVSDLEFFAERAGPIAVPLIVAIRPFESLRHAEWLANEVPGLRVPSALLERMQQAERDGRAADEGVSIAREISAGRAEHGERGA